MHIHVLQYNMYTYMYIYMYTYVGAYGIQLASQLVASSYNM